MESILHEVTEGSKRYKYFIEFESMNDDDIDPCLAKELTSLYTRVTKKQKNLSALIADIKKQIVKYPDILSFKNFLYCAYMQKDEYEKAQEINNKIFEENPGYLFGRINKAAYYLMEDECEKVPEVLGEMLELGELYPDRKKFHISEFLGFNKVVVQYAARTNKIELAKSRLEKMEKIAPDAPETEQALEAISRLTLEQTFEKIMESNVRHEEYNQVADDYLSLPQTEETPVFNHPVIAQLYRFSLNIEPEVFREILALPRETVIQDLQVVIYDSIRRFSTYSEEEWVEENRQFLFHAMVLLAELKASEALPVLLEILRQGYDYLEYWFADLLTDDVWEIYYQLFNAGVYQEYLQEPRNYTFAKSAISETFYQKAEKGELDRNEAIVTYRLLLQYFIDNRENDDLLDPHFMGSLITKLINLRYTELLPLIKTCFDLDLVEVWICGDYESVEKDFRTSTYSHKRDSMLATGFENFYAMLVQQWYRNEPDEDDEEDGDVIAIDEYQDFNSNEIKHSGEPLTVPVISNKPIIGRNDPCPCGSGKKFKKCCIDNLN